MGLRDRQTAGTAEALLVRVAEEMAHSLELLTSRLHARLTEEIEPLRGDPALTELLGASIASNLEALVQVIRYGLPLPAPSIPTAAGEYARRLAQRGTAPSALLRAYRLGQETALLWATDRIAEVEQDREVALLATRRFVQVAFQYVDWVSSQVVAEYESERVRWLANSNSVRAATLADLLAGKVTDITSAENALGYRLRQHHLAVVLWLDREGTPDDLRGLEHLLGRIGREVGANGTGLFIPQDRSTGWGWLPFGRKPGAPHEVADLLVQELGESGARIALGAPAPGIEGFRSTNLEARAAQELALVATDHSRPVTSWMNPDVRAASLMMRDLPVTRRMVATALGGLAARDESTAALRQTLRTFLAERNSYSAAARRLNVHKNTVRYRLERAAETRGRSLDEDRLELELALIASEWLGPAVLPAS